MNFSKKTVEVPENALHPKNPGVSCGNAATHGALQPGICNALQRTELQLALQANSLSDLRKLETSNGVQRCNADLVCLVREKTSHMHVSADRTHRIPRCRFQERTEEEPRTRTDDRTEGNHVMTVTPRQTPADPTAAALTAALISRDNIIEEPVNVVDGLLAIAQAIRTLSISVDHYSARAKTLSEAMTAAIRSISHGDINGPTGLEMLSMAVAGEGVAGHDSVAQAIRSASAEIAEVIEKSE